MSGRPHVLSEVALGERESACEIAVLPWGATEPHNLHLPFGTDTIQAVAVATESCRQAAERGVDAVVLPAIPMGANAQQLGTPMTLDLPPSTQALVLRAVAESLDRHGVRKLLVLNGHGGNDFKAMIRELQPDVSVFLCAANWWTVRNASDYFDEPGDHAGELETSVMLHVAPDWVLPLERAGDGSARVFRVSGLRDGVAWAPRQWDEVTRDTGVGDPRHASADRGAAFFGDVCATLADFLVELGDVDPGDLYRDPTGA